MTIGPTWALGRRLFSSTVGIVAAGIVAIYPFAWQYEVRLFPEALAVPLTLAFFLALTPWWYRTYDLEGTFVPLSAQDAALYGTFNEEAAADEEHPWAWRPITRRDLPLVRGPDRMRSESELRAALRANALDFIREHPDSVSKAFVYNGVLRTFDLQPMSDALLEVPHQGRSERLTRVGLVMCWAMLPLAVFALWRARRRLLLVVPVAATLLSTAVVFTADASTRYRAPLEPVIVVLAASTVVGAVRYVTAAKRTTPDSGSSATLPSSSSTSTWPSTSDSVR